MMDDWADLDKEEKKELIKNAKATLWIYYKIKGVIDDVVYGNVRASWNLCGAFAKGSGIIEEEMSTWFFKKSDVEFILDGLYKEFFYRAYITNYLTSRAYFYIGDFKQFFESDEFREIVEYEKDEWPKIERELCRDYEEEGLMEERKTMECIVKYSYC